MKMKLIRYGYLIRYAFDLGRIFPIIINQSGVSNFIAGISSHILNAPTNIWVVILNIDQQAGVCINGIFLGLGNHMNQGPLSFLPPEVLIQNVFG